MMDDHYPYIEPYAALTIAHSLLIQPYLLRKYVGYGLGNSLFKKYLDPVSIRGMASTTLLLPQTIPCGTPNLEVGLQFHLTLVISAIISR